MSAEFTKEQMADIVDGLIKSSYDFIPRVRRLKCSTCQKLNRGTTTCKAYPDEIPNDIILDRTPCEEYQEIPSEEKEENQCEKMITVDCGGYKRTMPESKLPLAMQKANELKEMAIKGGKSAREAEELFGLKVVEEKGYLYAEAANGLMERVPEDRYEDWKKEQDEIRAKEERIRQKMKRHAEELREEMLEHELKRLTDPEYRKKSDENRALFKKYFGGYGKKEL